MTAKRAIGNVALTLTVLAAGFGASAAWKRYGKLDPYSSLEAKAAKRPVDPSSAIQAKGVKLRHYENGKLVAQADADRLTVSQDHRGLFLKGVKNGVAQTAQGPMKFEANTGLLRPDVRMVDVNGNVHVQGQKFDVRTAQALIDGRKGELQVPTPLRGNIMGGDFVAKELIYRPNSDYMRIREAAWRGKTPQGAEVPASQQGRTWDMAFAESERKGRTETYTEARAEDGEVIVMAPKLVRDIRTDVLTATGRATYRSAKADLIADKIVVYRKEGRAVCTGNVVMLVRAKKDWEKPLDKNGELGAQPMAPAVPADLAKKGSTGDEISPEEKKKDDALRSGKTLNEYPMNLKAEEVTYWYKKGDRHAIAKGGDPTAYQKFDDGRWREARALQANYDGEKDMLDLLGDGTKRQVKMKNSIGDTVDAVWLQVSTKEDQTEEDEYMKSKSAIVHYVSKDDADDPRGTKADPKKATPPPPAKTEPPAKTTGG